MEADAAMLSLLLPVVVVIDENRNIGSFDVFERDYYFSMPDTISRLK